MKSLGIGLLNVAEHGGWGLGHTYHIFESGNFSLQIQKLLRPHVSVFKRNSPVHTYPDSLLVRQQIYKLFSASAKILWPFFFNNFSPTQLIVLPSTSPLV